MILIPLTSFDQAKLESFVSKVPEALIKEHSSSHLRTRLYRFSDEENFIINCESIYFNQSKIPSVRKCELQVLERIPNQEISLAITKSEICSSLKKYLPYGSLRSTEFFYGRSSQGNYQNLFSYSFNAKNNCSVSFAVKE